MIKSLKRLFYPDAKNNHQAVILQPAGLSLLIALFLLAQSFLNLSLGFTSNVLGFASDIIPEEIISLTNQERGETGLKPLTTNNRLNEAARQKAADMFALDYWAHVSPTGTDPWHFILNAGYQYRYAGENLARDFAHSENVIEAWLASPTHKDNIFNEKYQDIGVAVVNGIIQGQETTLVVQMFGAMSTGKPEVIGGLQPEVMIQEVAAAEEEIQLDSLNSFNFSQSLGLVFAVLLFAILAFDGWVICRKKTPRIAGHNFIHGTFVIILIIMMLLSQRGVIL